MAEIWEFVTLVKMVLQLEVRSATPYPSEVVEEGNIVIFVNIMDARGIFKVSSYIREFPA
jgi:hypothetical protein